MSLTRSAFLALNRLGYAGSLRPLIFRRTAQQAHHDTLALLRRADALAAALDPLFGAAHGLAFRRGTFHAGGVALDSPLILAAGLVKGDGFESEEAALAAAQSGADIMPGWRSMPRLAGPVEFGSFTRWPRPGNPGTAVWRDVPTRSTQNRIGLRNPGARGRPYSWAPGATICRRSSGSTSRSAPAWTIPTSRRGKCSTGWRRSSPARYSPRGSRST